MDTREKDIENLKDYKYGFTTDIENIRASRFVLLFRSKKYER